MKLQTLTILLCSTQILAGCLSSSGNAPTVATQYAAIERTGTNTTHQEALAAQKGEGVTAFVGNPDGTVSAVRWRLSSDLQTAYVSRDGGAEEEFTRTYTASGTETGISAHFYNASGERVYIYSWGDGPSSIDFYDNTQSNYYQQYDRGYTGLETAADNLPTSSASYTGYMYTYGDIYTNGSIAMDVDFGAGTVSGTYSGNASSGSEFISSTGISGTIAGSTVNSRIDAAATMDTGATGQIDMVGAAYDQDAQNIFGGAAGTLTIGGEDYSSGGIFYSYKQ